MSPHDREALVHLEEQSSLAQGLRLYLRLSRKQSGVKGGTTRPGAGGGVGGVCCPSPRAAACTQDHSPHPASTPSHVRWENCRKTGLHPPVLPRSRPDLHLPVWPGKRPD